MSEKIPHRDTAEAALKAFGLLPQARIDFVKQRENTVFKVTDGKDEYALRVHRHGHRHDDEVRSEILFMENLFEQALPVSQVVRTEAGEPFAVLPDGQGRQVQVDLQRWVPESAQFDDSTLTWQGQGVTTVEDFTTFGQLCGRFHRASARTPRIPGYRRDAWDLQGLTGDAPLWGVPSRLATDPAQAQTLAEADTFIAERLTELGTSADVYGVIHADFTPENVLRSPTGLTLIDFDDFGEGWWAFDLATILFWYSQHPRYEEFKMALLTGYRKYFELPQQAVSTLDALIVARGMTYLGWAADRPTDQTSAFLKAAVLPVVVRMAESLLSTGRIRKVHP
ncbi:phosphotransferase enzyme family protein [Micrococcoides hystricis]|uniref:Phosphotransferase enzyme family protein n=1 Tax=Micrococcoides hystricis TaxID=1572761 RepID=A0ABV6PBF3_9MICC